MAKKKCSITIFEHNIRICIIIFVYSYILFLHYTKKKMFNHNIRICIIIFVYSFFTAFNHNICLVVCINTQNLLQRETSCVVPLFLYIWARSIRCQPANTLLCHYVFMLTDKIILFYHIWNLDITQGSSC